MRLRVLVVGADGLVGSALRDALARAGSEVVGTSRRSVGPDRLHLDLLTDPAGWPELPAVDAAVICAGWTSIVACARDPRTSRRVNVEATQGLALRLAARGAFTLFISSNQVFDGRTPGVRRDAVSAPVSEYGRQKAAAERIVLAQGANAAVLRLSKVLTPDQPLLRGWRDALLRGEAIHPFADLTLAPIEVAFAVDLVRRIVERRQAGVFQASGAEDLPYVALGHALCAAVAAAPVQVEPNRADPQAIGFDRLPLFSSMDMSEETRRFGVAAPSSAAVIDAVVRRLAQSSRARAVA